MTLRMIRRRLALLAGLILVLGWAPLVAGAAGIRVLAFGDSLTAGYGLPPEQGLVAQLQGWLHARGHADVEVVNGGVSGETTAGGRQRIAAAIAETRPDAIIVELGGNDLLSGTTPPAETEANLDAILRQARTEGRPVLLVGIAEPERDEARRRAWAEIWPRLAARHGTLLLPNLYEPILSQPRDRWPALLQEDRIHASAEGVRLIVESLGPKVEELIAPIEAGRATRAGD